MGLNEKHIFSLKADASDLPFIKDFFIAFISVYSYNYFGRDENYLDDKLLPFVKKVGYIYIAVASMKKDSHKNLPDVLLLSYSDKQLEYLHDINYWSKILKKSKNAEIISIEEI